MGGISNIDDLREKLKRMTPSQVRDVVRMGKLHAKLKRKLNAGTISTTNLKVLAKIERNGILGA